MKVFSDDELPAHVCDHSCNKKYPKLILEHAVRKCELYEKTDKSRFGLDKNQINALWITAKLRESSKCCICKCQLTLHTWVANYPYQFSVDRIDDGFGHTMSNCQITCLRCNQNKAKKQYGVSEKNFHLMDEYTELVKFYKKNCYNLTLHERIHHLEKIYALHEQLFTKKQNLWIRALTLMRDQAKLESV